MKFYLCKKCGSIATLLDAKCDSLSCCATKMAELVPGTTDAAVEKHLPVIAQEGNTVRVRVGSVAHPMLDAHSITMIALETKEGTQVKVLKPGEAPEAVFALTDTDALVAAYEYCNLHGLWMTRA